MNTIKDRIKATRAQLRIAVKHYNQAKRILARLTTILATLEQRHELARAKQKTKPAKRK